MLLGEVCNGTWNLYRLSKEKSKEDLLFHVFRGLVVEYYGDILASAQVYTAYSKCLREIFLERVKSAQKDVLDKLKQTTLESTGTQRVFVQVFDNLCMNAFFLYLL